MGRTYHLTLRTHGKSMLTDSWTMLTDAVDALSVPPHAAVLVAVSGGPDSVALAHSFHRLSRHGDNRWNIRLAHVNHCLRGAESDEDEVFVRALAGRLKVEIDVVRVDTVAYATQHRTSIETAARELRYAELRRLLHHWNGDLIAVGHQQSDQAETVLMNLLRGSGLDGLSGMSARSGDIVRPFLQVSREMIIQALHAGGEPYRIDRSNADLGSRRNLLRHRVLPLLEGIHPTAGTTIARASNLLAEDASYLRTEAELALGYMDARFQPEHASANTRVFRVLHPAVQGRILRLLVGTVQGHVRDLSQDHISVMREAIMGSGSGRSVGSQFPHGLHLEVTGDRFHLFHAKPALESSPIAATLPIPGDLQWVHGRLQATLVSAEAHEVLSRQLAVCGPYHAFCDADVLGDHLLVRSRRPGDRLDSIHARGSNKLQDLFVDAKIPLHQRDRIPVLATPDFVAWVPGFGVHRRASVGPSTRRVAHVLFRSFL